MQPAPGAQPLQSGSTPLGPSFHPASGMQVLSAAHMPWPLQPQLISQASPLKPGKQLQTLRSKQVPRKLQLLGQVNSEQAMPVNPGLQVQPYVWVVPWRDCLPQVPCRRAAHSTTAQHSTGDQVDTQYDGQTHCMLRPKTDSRVKTIHLARAPRAHREISRPTQMFLARLIEYAAASLPWRKTSKTPWKGRSFATCPKEPQDTFDASRESRTGTHLLKGALVTAVVNLCGVAGVAGRPGIPGVAETGAIQALACTGAARGSTADCGGAGCRAAAAAAVPKPWIISWGACAGVGCDEVLDGLMHAGQTTTKDSRACRQA